MHGLCKIYGIEDFYLIAALFGDLMEYDDLELDTLGEKKTALFVIISDTDATFNFVVSIRLRQSYQSAWRNSVLPPGLHTRYRR